MKWLRRAVACTVSLLVAAGIGWAQTAAGTGVVTGTVTDNTRAVLPDVVVTVSGPAVMGTPMHRWERP